MRLREKYRYRKCEHIYFGQRGFVVPVHNVNDTNFINTWKDKKTLIDLR